MEILRQILSIKSRLRRRVRW